MAEQWTADIVKKSEKHRDKNAYFCKTFSLPDTERVVQGNSGLTATTHEIQIIVVLSRGKLFISTNFICYAFDMFPIVRSPTSALSNSLKLKIPYRKIESVERNPLSLPPG